MKLYVVSELTCAGYECEPMPTPVGVAATSLDALDLIEIAAGRQADGTYLSRHPVRFVIGGDECKWCDYDATKQVKKEVEYTTAAGRTYWSESAAWYVEEMELHGLDRDAMLEAIHEHDAAHGWIVPVPGYDHVHRVKADVNGTGT